MEHGVWSIGPWAEAQPAPPLSEELPHRARFIDLIVLLDWLLKFS